MDDKGMIKRLAALVVALARGEMRKDTRRVLTESRRLSKVQSTRTRSGDTVGTLGAFGGPDKRKRLVNGQVLDQSKACAKAGRRGGNADPKFGARVGERG